MTGAAAPSWERSHTAVRELSRLIPNFEKKIDEGSPEELKNFYAEVGSIVLVIGVFTESALASAWCQRCPE
jgi:hypothetical protein